MEEINLIDRLEGELDFEYKLRLCSLKLNKEIDLDWSEIVELLGLSISGDHLRKLSYGYKECEQYLETKKVEVVASTGSDILDELDLKIQELDKTRKKLQATKLEYNRNLRVDSRFELLYENVRNAIETITVPNFEGCFFQTGNKEYLLNFSDIHYGSNFKSENNEYSREICKQRFELLLSKTVAIVEKEEIRKLHILNCADSIQGLLRISDVRMNDIPIVEATIEVSKFLANWLNELSKYVEIVYHHVPNANHSQLRLLNTKASEMAAEDLEKIIVNYIHDVLINNPRIDVPVVMDKDYLNFNLCGYNFISLHGHQVKSLQSSIKDFSMLHRTWYDFMILGHFHGGQEMNVGEGFSNNTEVLVSPSIVGSCPYADSILKGAKSMAKLYVFEESQGHSKTYNLLLN